MKNKITKTATDIIELFDNQTKIQEHTDLRKTWFTIENKPELEKLIANLLKKNFAKAKREK